nr:ABC transporter permease subunit [Microbacterium pseudoresistens]
MAFVVLWQLLADYVITSPLIFTSPLKVAQYVAEQFATNGPLLNDIWTSGQEFLIGFTSAAVLGVLLGLALGANDTARKWANPLLNALYATPMLAIAPVLIVLLGLGLWPKLIIIFLECIFPVITGTMVGVTTTNRLYVEAGEVYGAKGWKALLKVYLPSSVPSIVGGLRLAIGRGVIGVIVAELFGSTAGLGHNIWNASQTLDMPAMYTSVLILAGVSVGGMSLLGWVHKKITPWEAGPRA